MIEDNISMNISVEDVKAAWSGVNISTLSEPDEPKEGLSNFSIGIGCMSMILLFLGFSTVTEGGLFLALIGLIMFVITVLTVSTKKNSANGEYMEMMRRSKERANYKKIEKLKRGYIFIGRNYQKWLNNGINLLRDNIVKYLNLSYSDRLALASEVHLDTIIPNVIPTSTRIKETMAEAYPLPKRVGCTFYFLTPKMLIISPTDGVRISSTSAGVLQNLVQKIQEVAADQGVAVYNKLSVVVDIESTSLNCLQFPNAPSIILFPDNLSSYELYFQEMVNIEYIQSINENTSSIVVTMRDGRQIKMPGNQKISDLLRLTLRNFKTAQPNILLDELREEKDLLNTEKVCPTSNVKIEQSTIKDEASVAERMKAVHDLFKAGIITKEEYLEKKSQLLKLL